MGNDRFADRDERAARVAALAARQWGCVTSQQLRACGLTRGSTARWREKGLLHRRHQGVYEFGAPSPAPQARWAAALLAAGAGAHLTRLAALALCGLWSPPRVTHVGAPRKRRGDATLKVHRVSRPETRRQDGLMVTTLPRTFLDLAAEQFPVERLVHEAAARRLVSLRAMRRYAESKHGRKGAAALLQAATNPHYRSLSERDFHSWLAARGILAEPNASIGGLTVDFHVPAHGVVIELDTEQTHGTAHAGRTDRARDERLRRLGLEVVRVEAPQTP